MDDLGGQAPLAGLQDSTVGIGEAREVEVEQLLEGILGLIEPGLELAGRGAQGRHGRRTRAGRGAARIAEQRLPRGGVGRGLPGGEERLGLARAQAVARHGVRQALLVAARHGRERGGRGGGEAAGVDVRRDVGRKPAAEGQAPVHPAATAAEELDDLGRRQVIVVGQRADDPRLVHGAQGATRRVGLQQAGLADDTGSVFHDHGHVSVAVAGPAGEAFEAVEHFVGAVPRWGHAQGQRGEGARGIGARPA